MNKGIVLEEIMYAMYNNHMDTAIRLWMDNNAEITARDFEQCFVREGGSRERLLEVLHEQASLYDSATYEIENSEYYPD